MLPVAIQDDGLPTKSSVVAYKKKVKVQKALAYLYQEGAGTLAQLAEVVHTSIPSITSVMEELVEEGWVNPIGMAASNNGRRPVLFSLNPDGHYVLIIDANTHETRLLLVNPLREVVLERTVDTILEDKAGFSEFLVAFVTETLEQSAIPRRQLMGIGLTLPGLIDFRQGLNLSYANLSSSGEPLPTWLQQQLGLPVFLINDTKATALGEHRFGGAQGKKHALSLNIDWGVGLGIIVNGEVFQGASGFAGELGHIQIDPDGERCYCGQVGCLDTRYSVSALVRHIQRAVRSGQETALSVHQPAPDRLTIDHLIAAAESGDAFARTVLREAGYQLGKGLSIAVMLFNPEIIIVDGVLAQASPLIVPAMQEAIDTYCLSGFRNSLTVEGTRLDGAAKWLGAHAYVMEALFTT
jgi:N-acetylglucosamine repressor